MGELLAVAKALRIAQSHGINANEEANSNDVFSFYTNDFSGLKKLMINTDSKYVIRCFMYWAEDWKAKGWKTSTGTLVENKVIIEEIDGIISTSGINLKWVSPIHSKIAWLRVLTVVCVARSRTARTTCLDIKAFLEM